MDRLTLRIENRSDAADDMPEDISVTGEGISIGRKASNDWSLPDNTRFISGQHVAISCEGGSYILEDVSTNGTFVNGSSKRVEGKHTLSNGDTIRIGSYIVAVAVTQTADAAVPQISGAQGVQAPPTAGTIRAPTTGIQRHVTTTTSAGGAQTPDFSRFQAGAAGATGVQRPAGRPAPPPVVTPAPIGSLIPDDFDDDLLGPASPDVADTPAPNPKPAPAPAPEVKPDPTPAPEPQPLAKAEPDPKPIAIPDEIPAEQVVPLDISAPEPSGDAGPFSDGGPQLARTESAEPEQEPAHADDPFSAAVPQDDGPQVEVPRAPEPEAQDAAPVPGTTGPFSLSDPTEAPMVVRDPDPAAKSGMVVDKTDMTPRGLGERFAETEHPRGGQVASPAPTPAQSAPVKDATPAPTPTPAAEPAAEMAPAAPAVNALLEGFLEGAGIDDADAVTVPLHELGVMLGKCARMGTKDMMQMLQDRSAVKLFVAQEDRTMRIASGNNPMKFMMDPDDAFKALFVQPRDGYQTGPDGFDNALTDIRQHQQAMMAAIQPALADMLEGLAPAEIADDVGGGRMGGAARKGWEEYNKRWESRAAQGENGMLDAFIDAFSRRYNQALDSL